MSSLWPGVFGRYGRYAHMSFPRGWSYELNYEYGRCFQLRDETLRFSLRSQNVERFRLMQRPNMGASTNSVAADVARMRWDLMKDRDQQHELLWLTTKAQYLPLHRKALLWDTKIIEHRLNTDRTVAAAPWPVKPPGWRRIDPTTGETTEEFFWSARDGGELEEFVPSDDFPTGDGRDNLLPLADEERDAARAA
eukprot:TRINITY_DN36983_c0_g1_i1.p2 TRINITY_DN36983_c0_g1~~TRINITY_DN36983_c0_g1_i1.p2  ORF type:complete len:194 (-),score=17.15 TRINITY_DN36983_c0_g1_i1:653-1234(-)